MDATLMFSASALPSNTPSSAAANAPLSGAQPVSGTDTTQTNTPQGRIFAGLMRDLLPTHERQDVAAAATSDPASLKSENLGGQLEVITTSSDQPDAGSLTAFARAQGLDESAVMALFGEKINPVPTAATIAATATAAADAAALNAALLGAQAVAPDDLLTPVGPSALSPMALLNMAMSKIASAAQLKTDVAAPAAPATDAPQTQVDTDLGIAQLAQDLSAEITVQVKAMDTQADQQAVIDSNTLTTASWLATQVASMVKGSGLPATPLTPTSVSGPAEGIDALNLEGSTGLGLKPTPAPTPVSTFTLPGLGALGTQIPLGTLPAATGITSPTVTPVMTPAPVQAMAIPGAVITTPPSTADEACALNAVNDLAPAVPTSQDAMRIRLVPAWANVTKQLHTMSGTTMTAAWGALTAAALGGPIRTVALDLRDAAAQDPLSVDDLSFSASSTDTPANAGTPELNRSTAPGMPLPASTPTLAGMAKTLRQEHYQQLADRLGQAMAERLQNQIARGEWKLQMRLNPANLGRIDVELDMHAKGLDAMFRSDNPLTRELMAQSMPKLKDSLSQSGMAVASVWVNSDAERQSDGKPTPQRDAMPSSDSTMSAKADKVLPAVAKVNRTPDGLDVLA